MNDTLTLNEAIEYFDDLFPHIDVKASLTEMQRQGRILGLQSCQAWLGRETRARGTKRQQSTFDNTPPAPGFCEWWRHHQHSGYCDKQDPRFGDSVSPHWGILPSTAWMILRYREEWEACQQERKAA